MQWPDARLVSAVPFVPHSFEVLQRNRHILPETTEAQWNNIVGKFNAITDVTMQRIIYRSDGLAITGITLFPQALREKAHPILIYNRGGSGNFGILTASNMVLLSEYAGAGYMVFGSNYRGNDGSEGTDEFGGAEIDDVLTLLDMARTHPAWDGRNIFMYGHSRGAMMTYLVIKHGAALNAAVAVAGPAMPEELEQQRPDMIPIYRRYIPHYDERPAEVLAERSAVLWADKLNVPLLLLHGDKDWRVDISHTLALDAALTQAGKPHKTIIYEGGDHSLSGFRREAMEEILKWYAEYHND